MNTPCRLLVSVRNGSEAESALAGGADLIDVKEPANGALGAADRTTIETVIRTVGGRAPVSAACGELGERVPSLPDGLRFAKFGLSGWTGRDWPARLERVELPAGCRLVAVAYADWQSCGAPPPHEVAAVAIESRFGAFLIDTFAKNGRTLLDQLSIATIEQLARECRVVGVPVALAGSLGLRGIAHLHDVRPDWIAMRGAACEGGRGGTVCANRVKQLKMAIEGSAPLEDSGRGDTTKPRNRLVNLKP